MSLQENGFPCSARYQERRRQARDAERIAAAAREKAKRDRIGHLLALQDRRDELDKENRRLDVELQELAEARQRKQQQDQFNRDFNAIFRVLNGQRNFPSPEFWPVFVDWFCTEIRFISKQTGKDAQELIKTSVPGLIPIQEQFLQAYIAMQKQSGAKDLYALEDWMKSHYQELRMEYFQMLLAGQGSTFAYFTALF